MAALPYITSPGSIDRALTGIRNASVPTKVSQDFVKTILQVRGGAGNEITSYLKRLGLTLSDGSPSDLYKKFRNPAASGAAVAEAINIAYAPLNIRNEYWYKLGDAELLGLVVEETGLAHDSRPTKLIMACIKHLKAFAEFGARKEEPKAHVLVAESGKPGPSDTSPHATTSANTNTSGLALNLGYTINLNLPATSDPEVFDAIFKSLKEHLLRAEDA